MKFQSFAAVILAAVLLFTLTACGKTQPPAATGSPEPAPQQTAPQNDVESSSNETPASQKEEAAETEAVPSVGDEAAETQASPAVGEEASEEEPWQTALAEDLFEKYGVLPERYEDLGNGIYQVYVEVGGEIVPFVTVDSATGDYHG